MLPKFKPGDSIISFNWAYLFSKPKVGEVVVLKKSGKDIIKRIQNIHDRNAFEIFVIGDNPKESTDSRSFGWIKKNQIIGKVIYALR